MHDKRKLITPKDTRTFVQVAMEHNRVPGDFDYNYPQNFYSHHPDVQQEAYLVVGPGAARNAHREFANGKVNDKAPKPW